MQRSLPNMDAITRGDLLLNEGSNGRGDSKSQKIRPINGSNSLEGIVGRFVSDSLAYCCLLISDKKR